MPSLPAVACSVLSMSTLACRFTIWVMPPRRFFNNRMNEVIDIIPMSVTLLNRSFLLIYQVVNILDWIIIVCRYTTCLFSTSSYEFMKSRCRQWVHGKWWSRILGHIDCQNQEMNHHYLSLCMSHTWFIDESIIQGTQLLVIFDIGSRIAICMASQTLIIHHIRQG